MLNKSIATIALLATTISCTHKTTTNISGLWTDVNSSNFTNGYVVIAQDGKKIIMNHYLEFKGRGMVEYGIGEIDGDNISYDVVVTKPIPGWAESGRHILALNKTKDTLKGIYKDGKGNSGPIVFRKLR